jgi:hypothetical protein
MWGRHKNFEVAMFKNMNLRIMAEMKLFDRSKKFGND